MERAFRLTLTGRRCLIRTDDGTGRHELQQVGFITARCVRAQTVEAASELALRMVRRELQGILLNTPQQPFEIQVEDVQEDQDGLDEHGMGGGFTWYPDED